MFVFGGEIDHNSMEVKRNPLYLRTITKQKVYANFHFTRLSHGRQPEHVNTNSIVVCRLGSCRDTSYNAGDRDDFTSCPDDDELETTLVVEKIKVDSVFVL